MAKEILLWDDPKYAKNKNGNQDLERFLANPALNAKDSFKKLNINYDDIKQSLYNLNKKNPEYQKELPSGLDNETGFVLKHQLDAFYNGYSDTAPDKVMGIENIKRLQNPTTKETIAKLIKEHDIKGDLNNVKTTNEDNIISLSRMGLLELNENGKRLSPKNTKKTVSDNMASAFKAKLENDPTYIASMKAKEKAEDKSTQDSAGKKSTLADELREMNAQIIADTNAYYASHGRPSLNSYSAVASQGRTVKSSNGNKTVASANKAQKTKQSSSKDTVSKNKKSEKSEAQTNAGKKNKNLKEGEIPAENQDAVNQSQNASVNNSNGSFQETGASQQTPPQNFDTPLPPQDAGNSNANVNYDSGSNANYNNGSANGNPPKSDPVKLNHYKGDTRINGANLSLEFELGKWRAEAYAKNPKAPAEKLRLENELNQKYAKMDANALDFWKKNYENSLKQEKAKPQNTETRQRVDALNLALQKTNEALKNKNVNDVQPMYAPNKVIANPKTVEDFKHNISIREAELKKYQKEREIANNEGYVSGTPVQQKIARSEAYAKVLKIEKKIDATKKEISVQKGKMENLTASKKQSDLRSGESEYNGVRTY